MNPNAVGNRAEAHVLAALLEIYDTILLPYGNNARYDLLIEDSSGFKRVQCKNGKLRNGVITFSTCSSNAHWNKGKQYTKPYYEEADYFGVYCPQLGTVYLVPVEECGIRNASLRIEEPKNNNFHNIRWADSYLIKSP